MTAKIARAIASVDERLGDRLHLIDRDNDGIVDVEEIRDALAAIALRQNKFREDPEALERSSRWRSGRSTRTATTSSPWKRVEKWFDSSRGGRGPVWQRLWFYYYALSTVATPVLTLVSSEPGPDTRSVVFKSLGI